MTTTTKRLGKLWGRGKEFALGLVARVPVHRLRNLVPFDGPPYLSTIGVAPLHFSKRTIPKLFDIQHKLGFRFAID